MGIARTLGALIAIAHTDRNGRICLIPARPAICEEMQA